MGVVKESPIRNDTQEAACQICSVSGPSDPRFPRNPLLINIQHQIVWRASPPLVPAATRTFANICRFPLMRPKIPPRVSHGKAWMKQCSSQIRFPQWKKTPKEGNILMSHKEHFLPRAAFTKSVGPLRGWKGVKTTCQTYRWQRNTNKLVCFNICLILSGFFFYCQLSLKNTDCY